MLLVRQLQVEFEDTMEQGYPAGERAIEGFLIHFVYGTSSRSESPLHSTNSVGIVAVAKGSSMLWEGTV